MHGLSQALQWRARFSPDRTAIVDRGHEVGFGTFWAMTRRLAAWLHRNGVEPGATVGVTVRDGLEHMATAHALLRLGCVQVSLPSGDPAPMRAELAHRCRVGLVVAPLAQDRLDPLPLVSPDFAAAFADRTLDAAPLPPQPSLDAPALLMASSGTTGRPKIVLRTQRQLSCYRTSELHAGLRTYGAFSVETNAGKWLNLVNLGAGRAVVFADRERHALEEICGRFGADNVCLFSPRLEEMVREARPSPRLPFEGVWFLVGGAPLSGEAREAAMRLLTGRLLVQYGSTETGGISAAAPGQHDEHPDTVGDPLYGVTLRIVDDRGAVLPRGERGFIQIRSPSCPVGYFDDEAATQAGFREGWFQPGDVGHLTPGGALAFAGRGDDMMILSTINIFPAEIESVASAWPGVRECAAFPVRSARHGDIPLLAVVADAGFDRDGLTAHCRRLLGVRAPRRIVEVEALPRGQFGKLARKALTERFAGLAGAPRSAG